MSEILSPSSSQQQPQQQSFSQQQSLPPYQKRKLIAEGFSVSKENTTPNNNNTNNNKYEKAVVKKFNIKNSRHYEIEKDIFSEINPHHLFPQVFSYNDNELEITMEYCKGGTLLNLLMKCGRFEEELAFNYFNQIANALRHLKKHSICHRDMKLENILILRDDRRYLKIVDLSFCARVQGAQNKQERRSFKGLVGTEGYQCPEMLNNQYYSGYEADIFSLGIILFEMIHGKPPFFTASLDKCEFYNLFQTNRKQYWEVFESLAPNKSNELIQLLESLLESDPDKRIALGKIFKTPWFVTMQRKQRKEKKENLDETQIDFQHYKQLSMTYNNTNFLSFLSRVFQNNHLYNSLLKIKQSQLKNINPNNIIHSNHLINQQSIQDIQNFTNKIDKDGNDNENNENNELNNNKNIQTTNNNKINQNREEWRMTNMKTNNIYDEYKQRQQKEQEFLKNKSDEYMKQSKNNNKYSLTSQQQQQYQYQQLSNREQMQKQSLSPPQKKNNQSPHSNLISHILQNKKVLYFDDQEEYNDHNNNRLNTEPSYSNSCSPPPYNKTINKPYQNIFQLIRQNCKEDIYMRLSYFQIFRKPVDLNAIRQKYSFKNNLNSNNNNLNHNFNDNSYNNKHHEFPSYMNRVLFNNNVANIAGFNL